MRKELKPCPFCGYKEQSVYGIQPGLGIVVCIECGAEIKSIAGSAEDAKNEVIDKWNTRAGWQDISTAPEDGTPVSLHGYNRSCPKWKSEAHDVFWTELNGFAGWHRRGPSDVPFALENHWVWTEWHHLPQPPEAGK